MKTSENFNSLADAVVLLDRGQGGKERLKSKGINLHCVFHIQTVLDVLLKRKFIKEEDCDKVQTFLKDNNFDPKKTDEKPDLQKKEKLLTYGNRAQIVSNSITKRLFEIIELKKTNLAFSVDITNASEVLRLADLVGPHICVLKTHVDIISDFSVSFTKSLVELSNKHNFIIFEDRKFADIGSTVVKQYAEGIYHIKDWAEITNAHAVPGDGVIKGLKNAAGNLPRACLLIAQMSAKGNLTDEKYTKSVVKMAVENDDFVIGFISTSRLTDDPKFVHMTPGVNLNVMGDSLGQQYLTPEEVITNRSCDIIIVGRGIYGATNPVDAALKYKEAAYQAYRTRVNEKWN